MSIRYSTTCYTTYYLPLASQCSTRSPYRNSHDPYLPQNVMPVADIVSKFRSFSDHSLSQYDELLPNDSAHPSSTAMTPWELAIRLSLAGLMLILTVLLLGISMMSPMLFDNPYITQKNRIIAISCVIFLLLLDLLCIYLTISLFIRISVYSIPALIILVIMWWIKH